MNNTCEDEIESIVSYKLVPKVGKYIVKLAHRGQKAEEVWMTERQLDQLERTFERTAHGHSTERRKVIGVWEGRFYRYAKLEETTFVKPKQYDLSDLEDEPW